jgi:hypothetical protein
VPANPTPVLAAANANSPGNLSQRIASAIEAYGQAKIQRLTIISQSAADPMYNTYEKLLAYPGGAWEFEFYLDKAQQLFLYREALDADELSLAKKGNSLWFKPSKLGWSEYLTSMKVQQKQLNPWNQQKAQSPGKGWRKVKTSLLPKVPYCYSQVTTLEKYPFLYLQPYPQIIGKVGVHTIQGEDYHIVRVKPNLPKRPLNTGQIPSTPDTPQELVLWVSTTGTPRIAKAVYFWVSHPPGGVLYTANLVTFQQQ